MRAFLIIFALMITPAVAQNSNAALIADSVGVEGNILTAEGNIEIAHDGTTLRAQKVQYDGTDDELTVTGPIYILGDNDTLIAADYAQLSGDLKTGLLQSARLVLNQQLQIAAQEITRKEGNITEFTRSVASSCTICEGNPTPIWEIRAAKITHDADEQQLHFEKAHLRVFGVPVFYIPKLRLPDPTVERASGFLLPELRSNEDLGVGIRIPYFFVIDDHSDLTLTPWITTNGARTLEARYREKYTFGEIEVNGAITNDNLTDDNLRGYLFAEGTFALPRGFKGSFDIEAVSDPGYLLFYGYSDKDRLDSAISVERAKRDELIWGEIIHYRSLRSEESNRTTPTIVADAGITRRFTPAQIGGLLSVTAETNGYIRRAGSDDTDSGLARDVGRLSLIGNWRRDWVRPNGLLIATEFQLRADAYQVAQDDRLGFGDTTELTPYGLLELRWPMLAQNGPIRHLIEPIAQFVWSTDSPKDILNEDSLLVEFDEVNLFEFSRFPGVDARERGRRLNLGLNYTRTNPDGWDLKLTVGRTIRERDLGQFSESTGLQGRRSDWLVAAQLELSDEVDIITRVVFDDELSIARNETRLEWNNDKVSLSSNFIWLEADDFEGRPIDTSEFSFDGSVRVARHWTLLSDLRYDFADDRTTEAGLGLRYQNECAQVDLSVSRRFTSSTNVTPTTDFSLSVQLAGFGAKKKSDGPAFTRHCN
ncbi:MAG: LPS assembly protein LptD [Litoreibacter sp.]